MQKFKLTDGDSYMDFGDTSCTGHINKRFEIISYEHEISKIEKRVQEEKGLLRKKQTNFLVVEYIKVTSRSKEPKSFALRFMPNQEGMVDEVISHIQGIIARREPKIEYEHVLVKVAGVTFNNTDKTSRQTLLKNLKLRKPPFDSNLEISLKHYEHEGNPACGVYINGMMIGNVPVNQLSFIEENAYRFDTICGAEVVGGNTIDGNKLSYGFHFRMRYFKNPDVGKKA